MVKPILHYKYINNVSIKIKNILKKYKNHPKVLYLYIQDIYGQEQYH